MMIIINKKQYISQSRGFTLLELLIYITILSGLMIVVSNMFITLSKGNGQTSAKSEVDASIRFATELLRQDLKNASAVSTPSVGTPSSTLVLTRGANIITYDISSGILRRKVDAATPVDITNANTIVSTPTFTRVENTNPDFVTSNVSTSIKIFMTFTYNSTSSDWKYSTSLQTSVNLYPH